jgi:RNA polymerase-binding transcription factor DksA
MTGDGWKPLINIVVGQCEAEGVKIHQIKEKFNRLRIYLRAHPRPLGDMVDRIERLSYHVCERCGNPGELRKDRAWLKTLCEECNAK